MGSTNYKAIFGNNLRKYRIDAGLTQDLLSEKADVSAQHLSYVEGGKRAPSFELIIALANVLGVEPGAFFVEKGRPTRSNKSAGKIVKMLSDLSKSDLEKALKILSLSLSGKK